MNEAARAGDRVGPAIRRVFKAFLLTTGAAGIASIFQFLPSAYPTIFSWLKDFLPLLDAVVR